MATSDPVAELLDRRPMTLRFQELLGVADLGIAFVPSPRPDDDPGNDAHVHAGDDLRDFTVEVVPEVLAAVAAGDRDARVALLHELLHIATRHICAVTKGAPDPATKAWLTQAIEEDTEALAEALERWIDR